MGESFIVNEVTIEKWVYGGRGLARTEEGVVLTPFVLPGEVARLGKRDKVNAELSAIVTPSADRVEPACPIFTRCGGCHYQHASYEFQLARKVEILREQLRRVGKIEFAGDISVVSGPALAYRNRAQFHIENGRIGYLAAGSHTLVPVEGECPTISPRMNQVLALLRERLGDPRFPKFVRAVEVFTNETDVQINVIDAERPVARRFYDWMESQVAIEYPTAHGDFRVSPKSFFQVNRFLIDRLTDIVLADFSGASAVDLYAGAGLFALPLAKQFTKVIAVEAGGAAAHDLAFNAQRAGAAIDTDYSRVEDFLASATETPDFVVADPPRAGLGPEVVRHLNRLAPPRIAIVSCDPATLARDLAAMPQYKIESLTLADLFPQTYHLETVVHLSAK
ncbi:MAG: class I SAM-dependent RNA methyltransferase [Acidobacteriota bacterium]